jgi:Protein of unknown function (DUF1360)
MSGPPPVDSAYGDEHTYLGLRVPVAAVSPLQAGRYTDARLGRVAEAMLRRARDEARRYGSGADRPLGGYAALLGVYAITGSAFGILMRRRRPRYGGLGFADLALLSVSTFKLSRVIARDPITSPVRAPFTRFEGQADVPSEVNETVRGSGVRKALGELLTCPFCTGQWVATALLGGFVVAPRETRLLTQLVSATAAADALHLAYAAAAKNG